MEQFADISIHPRSIAWLVRLDAWDQFEEIIYYNSAILGGYFNTIIPISPENNLLEGYYQFLIDFDPDIVVLAPEMESYQIDSIKRRFFPFAIVPWSSRSEIASIDPFFVATGMNIGVDIDYFRNKKDDSIEFSVATYDDIHKEMSKLALVSCGDILPEGAILGKMDEYISVGSSGYRENILSKLLKPECDFESIKSHLTESGKIKPPPNRKELKQIIQDKYLFPLSDPVKILEKCFQLQDHATFCESFIGLTRYYSNFSLSGLYRKNLSNKEFLPSVVILISDKFCLEEAILFWNLRANMVYVSWLSFSDLENNLNSITNWLESDFGGAYYATYSGKENIDIAFSTPDSKIGVLERILNKIHKKRRRQDYRWGIISRKKLIDYNSIKPSIVDTKVFISVDNQNCVFIPPFSEEISKVSIGVTTVDLKWTGLMMPQIKCFRENLLSSKKIKSFLTVLDRIKGDQICMPIWRITHDRYIRFQMDGKEKIEFYKPDKKEIIESLVKNAGYSCIKESNAARYHKDFIQRIGNIDKVTDYFKNPYLDKLFRLLVNNKDTSKRGWILNHPSKRRVLNHLELLRCFDINIPDETQKYFDKFSDILPDKVIDLLEKRILERGFLLKCNSCDFNSWYPIEQIGHFFNCSRCYKSQVYTSNPLLLYKLSEVVFQGFKCDMQVPLLALCYLKRMSSKNFEWVLDSDLYWIDGRQEKHQNLDILSLVDGKFIVGEAKSNASIKSDQFEFYKDIVKKLPLDGVVFATEKNSWDLGTTKRIENLKKIFDGEVIVLTRKELYSLV